jgi:hypothetical protein
MIARPLWVQGWNIQGIHLHGPDFPSSIRENPDHRTIYLLDRLDARKLQTADPKANLIHAVYSVGYKFEYA